MEIKRKARDETEIIIMEIERKTREEAEIIKKMEQEFNAIQKKELDEFHSLSIKEQSAQQDAFYLRTKMIRTKFFIAKCKDLVEIIKAHAKPRMSKQIASLLKRVKA